MRRVLGAVGTLTAGILALVAAPSPSAFAANQPKISFCHRTASYSNPYVLDTTDGNSIIKAGHGDHTGPIYPNLGTDGKWGDIIPPFDYDGGHFNGLNWPEGQAIVEGGCDVDITEPPETTTTTAPPGSTTTSIVAPPESSTTSSSTTSTTHPGSPPTTSPIEPPLPPVENGQIPPSEAVVVDPGGKVVDLGPLNEQERQGVAQEIASSTPSTTTTSPPSTIPGATTPKTGEPFRLEEIVAGVLVALGLTGLLALRIKRRVQSP
jgi:hypothetical protein